VAVLRSSADPGKVVGLVCFAGEEGTVACLGSSAVRGMTVHLESVAIGHTVA
jgi:hypothetical protein